MDTTVSMQSVSVLVKVCKMSCYTMAEAIVFALGDIVIQKTVS